MGSEWKMVPVEPTEEMMLAGWNVQAGEDSLARRRYAEVIEAAPPAPVLGVKVVPLKWDKALGGRLEAISAIGAFVINPAWSGGWSVVYRNRALVRPDGTTNFAEKADAIAYADAHYEQEVMSLIIQQREPEARADIAPARRPVTLAEAIKLGGGWFVSHFIRADGPCPECGARGFRGCDVPRGDCPYWERRNEDGK